MNMMMIDVTDIPEAGLEDVVVILGRQGSDEVTAEQHGDWAGTINYEVISRIGLHVPRQLVEDVEQAADHKDPYRAPNQS